MSTPNKRRNVRKARVVAQTQFDRQLIRVEEIVRQFHDLLIQAQHSPEDRESIESRLWAIRSRELPETVHSLEWAMKKAQMREFPMDAEGGT